MASTETLKIIIALKDAASKGIKNIGATLNGLRGKIATVTSGFSGLQALVASVGGTLLAKSFINAADAAEGYRIRLNVLLGDVEEGNRLFKEMADFASGVSYEYENIMASATSLAGVMKGGVDEVTEWMPLIADLAAASGLSIEETTGQIIRMYSAGAASADLFRERGILAMLGFTAGVSYSADETRKQLIAAFEDPASKFRGASVALAKSWSGMLSMMADRWFQFRNLVMDAGVFDFIKAEVSLVLKYMDRLKEEGRLDEWAEQMSARIITSIKAVMYMSALAGDAVRGWIMIYDGLILAVTSYGQYALAIYRAIFDSVSLIISIYTTLYEIQKALGDGIDIYWSKIAAVAAKVPILGDAVKKVAEDIAGLGAAYAAGTQQSIDKMNNLKQTFDDASQSTKDISNELEIALRHSLERLQTTASQTSLYERTKQIIKEINAEIKRAKKLEDEANKAHKRSNEQKVKQTNIALEDRIKNEIAGFQEISKTELARLEQSNTDKKMALETYYAARRKLIDDQFNFEMEKMELLKAAETDPKKLMAIELALFKLQEKNERDIIALKMEKAEVIKDGIKAERDAASIVGEAETRAATTGRSTMLDQFMSEMHQMEEMQEDEYIRLLELKKQGYASEEQLQALHHAQMLEKEKLLADQRYRLQTEYLNKTKDVISGVGSAFLEYYEATGKKHKEFFEIYKAAAIAETIISTYQSAQDAYNAMVDIPYVGPGLAVAAAAAAIAAGMARVGAIRAQNMAFGGLVGDYSSGGRIAGYSPYDTADNVSIKATAGEFMHPVKTVRHYGIKAMEAIRTMQVPTEVLNAFANPSVDVPTGPAMATGGVVGTYDSGQPGNSYSISVPVTTVDTMDRIMGRLQGEIEDTTRRVMKEELD